MNLPRKVRLFFRDIKFRDIKFRLKTTVKFLPFIWGNYWWDWYPLFEFWKLQLEWMAERFEKVGLHGGIDRHVREMRVCVKVLDRVLADDYWLKARYTP